MINPKIFFNLTIIIVMFFSLKATPSDSDSSFDTDEVQTYKNSSLMALDDIFSNHLMEKKTEQVLKSQVTSFYSHALNLEKILPGGSGSADAKNHTRALQKDHKNIKNHFCFCLSTAYNTKELKLLLDEILADLEHTKNLLTELFCRWD